MIAYIDDIDEYDKTIGLNVDLRKDFCGPICKDEEELANAIKSENKDQRIKSFQKSICIIQMERIPHVLLN